MEYWLPLVADAELAAKLTDEERQRLGIDRKHHDTSCSGGRLRLVAEASRAGVPIIAGPDSPNRRLPPGPSLLAELDLIRAAGLSVEQTLASATSHPADAYHLNDRGRIAAGLRADLLLVKGDASRDPRALWHPRAIWKAGAQLR